ncbi:MAG: hypothetical protein FJ026_02645 [Chloroflexi bacterium]|nr:hypothetical protein [Chloroflexota bacterium]
MEYPWYKAVEGDRLEQGDFLDACPVIEPPLAFRAPEKPGAINQVTLQVQTYDVVILTQTCDLEQEHVSLVLVCPCWSLGSVEESNTYFRSRQGKEAIRRGNVPGYHMLAACGLSGFQRESRVVDFRTALSLPLPFVKRFAMQASPRLRLLPPYREHLAQAFARFFMRVGLPVDIPPFT